MQPETISPGPSPATLIPAVRRPFQRYRKYLKVAIPLLVVLGVILVAILAHVLAPHSPITQELSDRLRPPAWVAGSLPGHFLGTDYLGRDVLSRLIFGARISLPIALSATLLGGFIGVVLGAASGYFGGWVDSIITKVVDIQLSFPFILFAIAVTAIAGPSLTVLIVVLSARSWTTYARVVRGATLSLRNKEFVLAAQSLGSSQARILFRHLIPNVLPLAIVVGTMDVGTAIVLESTLSFLGLGVQAPIMSWGADISDARQYIVMAWWTTTFPGLALLTTVLSTNMLGDGLRDLLDPQLRN